MEISNLRKDIIDIKNLLKLPKKTSKPDDISLMDLILDQITASSNINNSINTINNSIKEIKQCIIESNEQLSKVGTNTDFLEIINTTTTNIYNKLNNEINMQLRSINNSLISINGRLQEKLTPILTALNQIVTNTTK